MGLGVNIGNPQFQGTNRYCHHLSHLNHGGSSPEMLGAIYDKCPEGVLFWCFAKVCRMRLWVALNHSPGSFRILLYWEFGGCA